MQRDKWQNVLVLQTSFLGDLVLTLPLISEIKRRFPSSRLTLLCSPLGKELLQDHPDIDEIIADDKKNADRGFSGLRRKADLLREKDFTLALTPHKSLRSAMLLSFAGIPFRVGFRQSQGWFLFHKRADREAQRHDVERNLSILRGFNIEPRECDRTISIPVISTKVEKMQQLLLSLGVDPEGMMIGVNPGSVWPTKRWSVSGFARVIELLKQKYNCSVLLFGADEDGDVAGKIQNLCGQRAISLVGKVSLRELPAAIGLCRVFITNDSGPMHIAVARKIPTVAIFCATTPALGFYPYSANAIVLQKQLHCRPCGTHGGRRCPLGTEDCIHSISPQHVLDAVEKLVSRDSNRSPNHEDSCMPEFLSVG